MDKKPFTVDEELTRFEHFVIDRLTAIDKRVNTIDWSFQRHDEELKQLKGVVDEILGILELIKPKEEMIN